MGLLLYAKAAGEAVPDKQYRMQGNPILVRTLDLQAPFCKMEQQLGEIARLFEDSSCLRATQANKTVV